MNFDDAVVSFFKKYFVFKGRASRSENNYIFLFIVIYSTFLSFGLMFFSIVKDIGEYLSLALIILNIIFIFAMFIPLLSLNVRRVHDLNLSGWWVVVLYIPNVVSLLLPEDVSGFLMIVERVLHLISMVCVILLMCIRGTVGPNRFGPDPLATGDMPQQAPASVVE